MKKRPIIITLIFASLVIGIISVLPKGTFRMLYKQYKLINKVTYNVEIGETFEINLNQNAATCNKSCWLNENQVTIIENTKTEHHLDSDDKHIAGGGGMITFTFKGVKKGCDTLKFSNCPVFGEGKKCEDYTTKNTEVDHMYIINVTD